VTRIVLSLHVPDGAEDAYITFRYARHLAFGHGLVYNPGEHVMGFSSPLWTAWNAIAFLIGQEPLVWARWTALAADAVTLLAAGTLLLRGFSRLSAWCFTYFFAVWPYYAAASISGMESSLMIALIVVSAYLVGTRSPAGGVTLAALALTRPEGIAAAAALAIAARWRERMIALALAAAGLSGLALYYGTIVPQSVVAKALTYGTPGPWAGRSWWDWLVPFPLGRWPEQGDTALLVPLAIVAAPSLVLGARELWRMRQTPMAWAAAAALVVWLGYSVLGVTYFWWYLAVPLTGIALVVAVGLPRVAAGRALVIALALMVTGVWTLAPSLYVGRWQQESRAFGVAAAYLRANGQPGEKVMLEPIGMIGYAAPLVVVDEVGLVSPQVARRRQRGAGWYHDLVASEQPDWLVVRYGLIRTGAGFAGAGAPFRNAAERDSVFARYPIVANEPTLGDQSLVILRRTR
jgi:hypothetical protein